jgi:hypothetical protein
MYYGEDFIEASIQSIYDYVDRIFVFTPENAFGAVHIGRVDNSRDIVLNISDPKSKIEVIPNKKHYLDPGNQFTDLFNTYIYKVYPKPDAVMCIEPDMVWHKGEIEDYLISLDLVDKGDCLVANHVEFWHNFNWVLPWRYRKTLITHRLGRGEQMPDTDHSGHPITQHVLTSAGKVYNFGFCVSPENMKIKCHLGIKYSKFIRDSIPNEDWYEEKWLKWHPIHNNKNLEISNGYEHLIPKAVKNKKHLNPMPSSLKNHQWNPNIFTQAQE